MNYVFFLVLLLLSPVLSANLLVPRTHLTASSVGGNVFFGGGTNKTNVFDSVEILMHGTNNWTYRSLLGGRWHMSSATSGSKVLFAGGLFAQASYTDTDFVDIIDGNTLLKATATLNISRFALTSVSTPFLALFAGGNTGYAILAVVDIYNQSTGIWNVTQLSAPREFLAGAFLAPRFALFGGGRSAVNANYSNVIDVFNTENQTWMNESLALVQARSHLVGIGLGSQVFFAGGETSPGNMSDIVDILSYTNTSGGWNQSQSTLSEPRRFLAVAAFGSRIFFGGGELVLDGACSDMVDIYDVTTGLWYWTRLSVPRMGLAATNVNSTIYFAGGQSVSGSCDTIDIFDANANYPLRGTNPVLELNYSIISLEPAVVLYGSVFIIAPALIIENQNITIVGDLVLNSSSNVTIRGESVLYVSGNMTLLSNSTLDVELTTTDSTIQVLGCATLDGNIVVHANQSQIIPGVPYYLVSSECFLGNSTVSLHLTNSSTECQNVEMVKSVTSLQLAVEFQFTPSSCGNDPHHQPQSLPWWVYLTLALSIIIVCVIGMTILLVHPTTRKRLFPYRDRTHHVSHNQKPIN